MYEFIMVPAMNAEGAVEAVAGTARDMTERRQLEFDLLREKAISDTIIESAPGAFFMIDEEARLVRWNKALATETGLSEQQIKGSSILSSIYAPDRAVAAAKFLQQEFARCRRYGHPLSLWMLDIDHFKMVNDTYGHQAGDVALQSVAATSREALRDWDILGRMGGEEFAVLLPETEPAQSLAVAERLRQIVSTAPVPVEKGATTHLTVSIGIATAGDEDADFDALLVRADRALYEAKRTGRVKVCLADWAAVTS